jgi:anaerobic magnesium-protoporphyrin IX monomethyl ester cyclase
MKILLLRARPDYSDAVIEMPIGLAQVGAIAERLNHEIDILDLVLERDQETADLLLKDKLRAAKYDLVGITGMTPDYGSASRAARMIKAFDAGLPIVFGGQHATLKTDEVVSQDFCDFVVRGEGEQTFEEFLKAYENGRDYSGVAGLAFKRDGAVVRTPDRPPIEELDKLPFPAYHKIELERYFDIIAARVSPKDRHCIQIFTSRGCPWRCIYCHALFGKSFRARSAENVMAEIQQLYDRGIRDFIVEDDVFNLDMNRAKRIFDMVKASKLDVHFQFNIGLRLERFDEELVRKMAEGGTYFISIAVESASPRIQKLIRKNLQLDRAAQAVSWMRKYKIRTLGFFMLGFPSETLEDVEQTIKFACDLDLDEALFSIATPYPGTEFSQYIREMGWYDPDLVSQGKEAFHQIRTDHFDYIMLKKLQRKAYIRFFLSRRRYLRLLPRLLNFKTSMKYLKASARVMTYGTFDKAGSTRIN